MNWTHAEIIGELAARNESPARFFSSKEVEESFNAAADALIAGDHPFVADERFDCSLCGEGPSDPRHERYLRARTP